MMSWLSAMELRPLLWIQSQQTEVPKTKLDQCVPAQIKPSEASSNILSTTEPTKAVQNQYKWHLQECAPIGVVGLAGKADSVHSLLLQSCTWYIKTVEFIVERQWNRYRSFCMYVRRLKPSVIPVKLAYARITYKQIQKMYVMRMSTYVRTKPVLFT